MIEESEVTEWIVSLAAEADQALRITLSGGSSGKMTLHSVTIKNRPLLQLSWIENKKAFHRNLDIVQSPQLFGELLGGFNTLFVATSKDEWHLTRKGSRFTRKRRIKTQAFSTPQTGHNRAKQHAIPIGEPDPYMIALGLMTHDGKLIASKAHKFRQINRFLELVAEPLQKLPSERPLHIVDLGCGKAYLTFALYHYLSGRCGRTVTMSGVDLKADVLQECQELAHKLGYHQLDFHTGSIESYQPTQPVDVIVSLHACNTATDAALAKGVSWKAQFLFAAPCCQHELYAQVANEALDTLLRQGILKERFAALATDAARADLLEAAGYRTQIIEFIDLEHSPKNLLLRAEWAPSTERQRKALERYQAFKHILQISPTLESLLLNDLNTNPLS